MKALFKDDGLDPVFVGLFAGHNKAIEAIIDDVKEVSNYTEISNLIKMNNQDVFGIIDKVEEYDGSLTYELHPEGPIYFIEDVLPNVVEGIQMNKFYDHDFASFEEAGYSIIN